jgi:uncharacterized membrane protein
MACEHPGAMTSLVLAGLFWLLLHIGVSGSPLRGVLVGAVGENSFRGVFAVLAIASLVWMIFAYDAAAATPLWEPWPWTFWLADIVMLPAFVLFMASLTPANPTAARPPGALAAEPRGVFRITRHPMMVAIGLWAAAHLLATGDSASLVVFGTFLLTVLAGIPSIEHKLARRDPQAWARLAERTSRLPFAAILAGRNRLVLAEIRWFVPALGIVAWVAMLLLHERIIGVPATPP